MDRILLYGLLTIAMLLSISRAYSPGTPAQALRYLREDETVKRAVLQSFLPIMICLVLVFTADLILLFEFGAAEGTALVTLHVLTLLLLFAPIVTFIALPSYVVVRHWRDQRDAKKAKARARAARK